MLRDELTDKQMNELAAGDIAELIAMRICNQVVEELSAFGYDVIEDTDIVKEIIKYIDLQLI